MSALLPTLRAPDDRVALRYDDRTLSHRELAGACAAHLARLADHGVQPGDRVGVWTHPGLETAVALAAHAAGGLVSVPLNPKLGPRELGHILSDAAPRRVVAADPANLADATPGAIAIRVEPGPGALPDPADPSSPALVLYTSGTTGPPKGAVITRRNIAFDLDALAAAWEQTPEDTVVHALPLFHVHGLVLGLFGALRAGGALRWLGRFDPAEAAAALAAGGPTLLFGVPTMYHRLADAAEADPTIARDLAAARLLISGSAGLPVREHRRVEAVAGRGVLERYGLTETLINCSVRASTGPRPGTVGPPLDGVELRLVNDAREAVHSTDGTLAEIAVRGPHVFDGYLNRPDATAAVSDADGWFYTGDLATRDADGAIRIVGRRATDLIKTGGFKVGAGEVEAALLEDPGVAEVAVVGLPDDDLGERIVAFVVARAGAAPSADALADRVASELTPHKRPREVRFVDALPRNAMGKVVKPRLVAAERER